jgi:sugar lactone lactonase YvrE
VKKRPINNFMGVALRTAYVAGAFLIFVILVFAALAKAQSSSSAPNDLPNPYKLVTGWAQAPSGRTWGRAGVAIAPDGDLWAYDRCGSNTCANSQLAPIIEFDQSGKLLRSFGEGMIVFPHGIYVDSDSHIWINDARRSDGRGLQVFKFDADGKKLLTLGKAGVSGETEDTFGSPTDVVVGKNGDIFVSDGHEGCDCTNARIIRFSKNGKFIKAWGKKGSAPGELDGPHALALDSQGRLFVADRSNSRIQIFDQNGTFIAAWRQFGRPSGIFIDKDDTLYVTDSESKDGEGYGHNPGVQRGVRIGSAKTGVVKYFVPSPASSTDASETEGVTAAPDGTVYLGLRFELRLQASGGR